MGILTARSSYNSSLPLSAFHLPKGLTLQSQMIHKLLVTLEMLGGFAFVFIIASTSLVTGEDTPDRPDRVEDVPEKSLIEMFDQIRENHVNTPHKNTFHVATYLR